MTLIVEFSLSSVPMFVYTIEYLGASAKAQKIDSLPNIFFQDTESDYFRVPVITVEWVLFRFDELFGAYSGFHKNAQRSTAVQRLILGLFVPTLFMPLSLFAQPSKYLKLGVNFSTFRTEGGKSELGLALGFGKKYNPIQNFDGFWGFELGYARERILLEDKTWPTNFSPPYSGVVNGDFEISLGYFDLSLYLGYLLNAKKIVRLEFFVGPSLSIPVGNSTKVTGSKTTYLEPEEIADYDFDFYHYDADPGEGLPFIERGMNLKTSMVVGTKLHWRNFHLSLNYSRALNETEGIVSLTLFDKIDRLALSVGTNF